ncbi:MAG: proton extrusion protein PcxA [Oscillatoriales cyanobacterium C42_A2020_001]|nr:proton extrusion protein PcxA [Leptolyngbyaceae cyanobacterium C42_A2020_001]
MTSFLTSIGRSLRTANRWLIQTPDRALDQAYDAALMIKAIEDQHFNGDKISNRSNIHSDRVFAYFQTELRKYLQFADVRLKEFRASRYIVDSTNSTLYNRPVSSASDRDRAAATLEKLRFIDEIIARYKPQAQQSKAIVPVASTREVNMPSCAALNVDNNGFIDTTGSNIKFSGDDNSILDKTGVLPRSILGTLNRIKRDLDPKAEEQVIQTFRTSKVKTLISIRLILLLIIVPLLVQQLSKSFVVGPIVDRIWKPSQSAVFLNYELEEEALKEFNAFKERLEFRKMVGTFAPAIEQDVKDEEALLQEKAQEIAQSYSGMSANAIKNIFSDLLSLVAFVVVLVTNREGLEILKSFIDETVYGLSDSAKAFIIILFTDMFVGFHSPHGWEVLLEGIARHIGLPANRNFIFLFIATFPVILDTIFKYWIFRYLNRISPSAVATYKNMNET